MEKPPLGKTFIKAWRKHRAMSQEALASAVEITTASLSRIENNKQPYNQRQLELMATALKCSPGDLIDRDPDASAEIVDIWPGIPPGLREQALITLKSFVVRGKA